MVVSGGGEGFPGSPRFIEGNLATEEAYRRDSLRAYPAAAIGEGFRELRKRRENHHAFNTKTCEYKG
jgi:hypothetical protein